MFGHGFGGLRGEILRPRGQGSSCAEPVDVLLIGPSDLSIELGVPLDYQCEIYQRALDKIAATGAPASA